MQLRGKVRRRTAKLAVATGEAAELAAGVAAAAEAEAAAGRAAQRLHTSACQ